MEVKEIVIGEGERRHRPPALPVPGGYIKTRVKKDQIIHLGVQDPVCFGVKKCADICSNDVVGDVCKRGITRR